MTAQISGFLYKYIFFFRYLPTYGWDIMQIIFICIYAYAIRKFRVSGRTTAIFGMILLFITMIFNIVGLDDDAGLVAQYVFILFTISIIQEFYRSIVSKNNL